MRDIRKIVLVEPKSEGVNVYTGIHIPRLGAVLLATILRGAGYEAKVFSEDIAPLDEEEIFSADLVGISALTNTARAAYALAARCRERDALTVMGGTHATFMAEEALDHVDFVVKGEGEAPLLELISALNRGRPVECIANLAYWTGGGRGRGEKRQNPIRPFVKNLDTLPIPDFGLVHGWGSGCVAAIMTSRGCPYDCSFCSVTAMHGRGYRYTSEDRVLEELRRYKDRDYLFFCDDNFTVDRKRTKRILRRKIREGLGMQWSAQVRTEITDDVELLELMRASNCFNVYVGFESFNPRTLVLYNKRMEVDRIRRSMDLFHKNGIKVHGMFVLGSDADDAASLRNTARLAHKLEIDTIQYMILTPIPGTVLTKEFQDQGRIRTQDWTLFDGHYVTYEPRRLTPYELQSETLRAYRKFYSWARIGRRALQRDKWVTLLRINARRFLKTWRRDNRAFFENLREEVFAEARRLAAAGRKRVRRIAVVESQLRRDHLRFLSAFFRRLGVRVIPIEAAGEAGGEDWAASAREALARLRHRVDFLVLPSARPWRFSEAAAPLLEMPPAPDQTALLRLPLDEDGAPSYPAFVRIGAMFTKRLRKIRRAYELALRELEREEGVLS
ncbi:MAG: radical SAM protein [bacterium]